MPPKTAAPVCSYPAVSRVKQRTEPLDIEDYAVIGDLQTAALVGRDGSIDWLCLPSFASGACFAAILGTPQNGRWLLRPKAAIVSSTRKYQDRTLVLETTFETRTGAVCVTDFMPVRGTNPDVVRVVRGLRGRVRMYSELVLRFDYGRDVPWVTAVAEGLRAIAGPDMVILRTPVKSHGEDLSSVGEFTVSEGEEVPMVLTYGASHLPLPPAIDWQRALRYTQRWWRNWMNKASFDTDYVPQVQRSLITLKALTFRPTGGIVAAPTTSLPEKFGDGRNWDYRYCWLRDTTLTLLALLDAGFWEEGRQWHDWLLRALAGSANQVQIMYGLYGERRLTEEILPYLSGYQGAKPVRIGNAASGQVQLDIYGEVLDAIFHGHAMVERLKLRTRKEMADNNLPLLRNLLAHLESIWQEPDSGIWEIRGKPRHYTHSKVMAWVAFDRAVHIAKQLGVRNSRQTPVAKWAQLRDRIHRQVCRDGFDKQRNTFVQSYGSRELDASLLLLPLVGFLPPDDPRIRGTVAAVEKNLMDGGFVARYRSDPKVDRLERGEGVFLACSFWMVSNLRLQGRRSDAKRLFEKLISLSNDVGLLAEEYDPRSKRLCGNFPQAFSHIALVNAAFGLGMGNSHLQRRVRHGGDGETGTQALTWERTPRRSETLKLRKHKLTEKQRAEKAKKVSPHRVAQ